ncbi:Serine/threonine-protein kinase RsbT [Koleobacter methoxysyntrophicus]|uniref:Serine/threonine-protein kinase RsbT n=1 Tax=Koleobacter methoxysyntrophicus TaxID=2751313 RepID=A0A8A0RQM5_9FIRM|nr:Serine/threonine-protein kinase RsbT [Koleobacter methoxysyntrophicus]
MSSPIFLHVSLLQIPNDFALDENKKLVGIISVLDIIKVLEHEGKEGLDMPLEDVMTYPVETLLPEEDIVKAFYKFKKYGFGRLPVIDTSNRVIGIITPMELAEGFARYLGIQENTENITKISDADRQDDNVIKLENSADNEEGDKALLNMRFNIIGGDFNRAGEASGQIKAKLKQLGIDSETIRRAAIASYEAEMNIVIHAYEGALMVTVAEKYIKIIAKDKGPGIPNIELAMQEGYSTASDKIRELGFGAGMGLPNMKRCSDEFEIQSEVGVGTSVKMVIRF